MEARGLLDIDGGEEIQILDREVLGACKARRKTDQVSVIGGPSPGEVVLEGMRRASFSSHCGERLSKEGSARHPRERKRRAGTVAFPINLPTPP